MLHRSDYWGLTRNMSGYNKDGVSIIFLHSEKGKALINNISTNDFTIENASSLNKYPQLIKLISNFPIYNFHIIFQFSNVVNNCIMKSFIVQHPFEFIIVVGFISTCCYKKKIENKYLIFISCFVVCLVLTRLFLDLIAGRNVYKDHFETIFPMQIQLK